MMKHFFERRTPSVYLLSGYLSCLNSVSVNILPIQGKITNFGKHKSQSEVWTSGYLTRRPEMIVWVWGFLCSSFPAGLFAVFFFSKKLIYFLRLKVMELISLFSEEGCVLNTWKMDLLKMLPLCQ